MAKAGSISFHNTKWNPASLHSTFVCQVHLRQNSELATQILSNGGVWGKSMEADVASKTVVVEVESSNSNSARPTRHKD
jgi:hypothetical protein